ncbi:hypothetical protein [Chryseobacterium sp. CH1]|uniref:hypothetical protein n=1 Tax=Chryseobacterium sp. CH1 TaxID=713551 RepID=UPI001E2A6E08|nr:hypothetical protein [Chryseobacterium sp. CH1]
MNTYIDIGINLTNKQFYNEHEEIINRALDHGVESSTSALPELKTIIQEIIKK